MMHALPQSNPSPFLAQQLEIISQAALLARDVLAAGAGGEQVKEIPLRELHAFEGVYSDKPVVFRVRLD